MRGCDLTSRKREHADQERRDRKGLGHHFCDELKRAGDVVLRDTVPQDDPTRAEGYRHLVRMVRAGFESTCEFADTHHPELVPMVGRTLLYEGVTPDARYHHAFIDGTETYRVRGQRGTAPFIEFSVYTVRRGSTRPATSSARLRSATSVSMTMAPSSSSSPPASYPGTGSAPTRSRGACSSDSTRTTGRRRRARPMRSNAKDRQDLDQLSPSVP